MDFLEESSVCFAGLSFGLSRSWEMRDVRCKMSMVKYEVKLW